MPIIREGRTMDRRGNRVRVKNDVGDRPQAGFEPRANLMGHDLDH